MPTTTTTFTETALRIVSALDACHSGLHVNDQFADRTAADLERISLRYNEERIRMGFRTAKLVALTEFVVAVLNGEI